MMKVLFAAILATGIQHAAPVTSHAQSGPRDAAKKLAVEVADQLAQEGVKKAVDDVADRLARYFRRNQDEMNKPKSELKQRLAACRTANSDPLCAALRRGPR